MNNVKFQTLKLKIAKQYDKVRLDGIWWINMTFFKLDISNMNASNLFTNSHRGDAKNPRESKQWPLTHTLIKCYKFIEKISPDLWFIIQVKCLTWHEKQDDMISQSGS